MLCPICGKRISVMEACEWDCRDCKQDFEQQRFKFVLPESLNRTYFTYYDYVNMGKLFRDLASAFCSPEEYDAGMQKLVKEINARGESPTPRQIAFEAEQKRARDYAQSLLRH